MQVSRQVCVCMCVCVRVYVSHLRFPRHMYLILSQGCTDAAPLAPWGTALPSELMKSGGMTRCLNARVNCDMTHTHAHKQTHSCMVGSLRLTAHMSAGLALENVLLPNTQSLHARTYPITRVHIGMWICVCVFVCVCRVYKLTGCAHAPRHGLICLDRTSGS